MNEPVIEVLGEAPRQSTHPAASMSWLEPYVAAAGQLAQLNSRALNTAIEEQRAIALEAASDRSLLTAWRLQGSYALAGVTKSAAWLRHVSDILLGAYAEAVSDAERRVNQTCMAATGWLDLAGPDVSSLIVTGDPGQGVATRPNEAGKIVGPEGKALSS